ncbi:SMI1/KNR4 family protein [Shewanella fidelis]|uniref:SMI1/KNR4 family protein n=1 Tax=Shewanella fidelis TaxID=173509 RepID=UPI00048F185C|nr:SMI1/KNR4 family protein [Shewanella fidelis]
MLVENRENRVVFHGDAATLIKQNPKLTEMRFIPSQETLEPRFISELNLKLGQALPSLFVEFIQQCGGFDAGYDFIFPCAQRHDDPSKLSLELKLPMTIIDGSEVRCQSFSLFEGLYLPGGSQYQTEISVLEMCFAADEHQDELQGRDWQKLVPFASNNGDVLCLDFNQDGEPNIVYVTYDGVGIYPILPNFEALLLALDYKG